MSNVCTKVARNEAPNDRRQKTASKRTTNIRTALSLSSTPPSSSTTRGEAPGGKYGSSPGPALKSTVNTFVFYATNNPRVPRFSPDRLPGAAQGRKEKRQHHKFRRPTGIGVNFPEKVDFWTFPRCCANIPKISCKLNCETISQEQADFLRSAAPALLVPALFCGSTQGINDTLVSIRAGAYIG